jgi:hypothetical protein
MLGSLKSCVMFSRISVALDSLFGKDVIHLYINAKMFSVKHVTDVY